MYLKAADTLEGVDWIKVIGVGAISACLITCIVDDDDDEGDDGDEGEDEGDYDNDLPPPPHVRALVACLITCKVKAWDCKHN